MKRLLTADRTKRLGNLKVGGPGRARIHASHERRSTTVVGPTHRGGGGGGGGARTLGGSG